MRFLLYIGTVIGISAALVAGFGVWFGWKLTNLFGTDEEMMDR